MSSRLELSDAQRLVYDRLPLWRKNKADREGAPSAGPEPTPAAAKSATAARASPIQRRAGVKPAAPYTVPVPWQTGQNTALRPETLTLSSPPPQRGQTSSMLRWAVSIPSGNLAGSAPWSAASARTERMVS
mgnify:CR=1